MLRYHTLTEFFPGSCFTKPFISSSELQLIRKEKNLPGSRRAHAADEVITYGKILRKCGGAHGELGNDQPFGSQLRGECAVVRGIDDIDAAAENSDGFPLRSESRLVCRGVDPPPFHSQW